MINEANQITEKSESSWTHVGLPPYREKATTSSSSNNGKKQTVESIWGIPVPRDSEEMPNTVEKLQAELAKQRSQFLYVAERAQKLLDFLRIEQTNTERYMTLYEGAISENEELKKQLAKLQGDYHVGCSDSH
jgi:hypothetical protein